MRALALAPALLGLALLIAGVVFHSELLGTAGVALVALSLGGYAAWRAKVAEARLVVALDDEIKRNERDWDGSAPRE
jgi:hypothetical protein